MIAKASQQTAYATGSDFCQIFKSDMRSLYLLSLLLTGDSEKAEQCFVTGLDDCAADNQVFREWARSWARRAVIKNAIRLIAPQPTATAAESRRVAQKVSDQMKAELRAEIFTVASLEPFERFAFVMSVLEGYSDRDCTLLLGCTRETLIAARNSALQRIAHHEQPNVSVRPESGFSLAPPAPLAMPA